jgi:hypothetical protein
MFRKLLVSCVCVSVLLPVFASCDNPADFSIQENRTGQEDTGSQGSDQKTSDTGQSDPDDPVIGNNPEDIGEDSGADDDRDEGKDPDNAEDPEDRDVSGDGDQPDVGDGSEDDEGSGAGENESALIGAEAVQAYLDGQEQNTAENPYSIEVKGIKLSGTGAGNALKGLYFALTRYAALDLGKSYGENFANVAPATALNKDKITGIILPPGLHTINVNAFVGCTELVSADLSGTTTISGGAFNGCVKLETLVMDEVSELKDASSSGKGVFYNCASLVSVSLPRAAKIGIKAFDSCESLATVYAPQATHIGDKAFAGCNNLEHITLGETPPAVGKNVFAAGKPEAIYVPASAVDTYKNTAVAGWTDDLKAKVQPAP